VRFFDARAARVLATILLFGLVLMFIYLAWRTLVTFLFAILFAYLLEPVVSRMQSRLHMGRGRAVALLYVILAAGLGAFFFYVGPSIVQQATRLSDNLPQLAQRISSGQIARQVGSQRGWSYQTQERIQQFLASHQAEVSSWVQSLLSEVGRVAGNVVWVLLVPILAIFFLLSGGRFAEAILDQLARRRQRSFVGGLLQDVHDVLASYIRIQIFLAALTMLVYLTGFVALRIPYAVALGVAAGLLDFIPVIGPLIGALIVLGTAFFVGYPYVVVLALFIGAWRVIMDYYISPRLFGGQVQLHPLAVLFGVIAGGEVAGVIGVYLSIPIMASLRVLWVRWRSFEGEQQVIVPPSEPFTPPATPPPPPSS